jgi:hypothetical protein
LNERHRNFHYAKQEQRKKALVWCAEPDLTDRTLFTAPNRQQPTVDHPVFVRNSLFSTFKQTNGINYSGNTLMNHNKVIRSQLKLFFAGYTAPTWKWFCPPCLLCNCMNNYLTSSTLPCNLNSYVARSELYSP